MLHMGTNYLTSENNAKRMAKSIIDSTKNSVKDKYSVSISSIIAGNGNLNIKAETVNVYLRSICSNACINLIENSRSINPKKHLNNSKLHLNLKGCNVSSQIPLEKMSSIYSVTKRRIIKFAFP